MDWNISQYDGDQIEVEHNHELFDQPGVIRILGFRNRENMGTFKDAIAIFDSNPQKYNATTCTSFNYDSQNSGAPDLCWARKANIKMGIGINFEQQLTSDIGVFLRGMYNDGRTEVYSYTSTDRSLSLGTLIKGGALGPRARLGGAWLLPGLDLHVACPIFGDGRYRRIYR